MNGSITDICETSTGQCVCREKFIGRRCDNCASGYSNIELNCIACECNSDGSETEICDPNTGQCLCKMGITGQNCDICGDGFYGFSSEGCTGKFLLHLI